VSVTLFRLEVDNFIQYQDCTRDAFFVCTTSATNANVPGVSTFQGVELSWSDAALGRRDADRGLYLHRRETGKAAPA
jgi:outer membrane cobalamin receptor